MSTMGSLAPRAVFGLIGLACVGLLAYAYYLQFHDHLEPCPMCIFQRLAYAAVGVVALIGAAQGPRGVGVYLYGAMITVAAGVGAGIAARQVWLQHLPADRVPECGPGLAYMLEAFPLAEVIRTALRGTGECAVVDWTLLGFSMAEWSVACFLVIILATLLSLAGHRRRPREWA